MAFGLRDIAHVLHSFPQDSAPHTALCRRLEQRLCRYHVPSAGIESDSDRIPKMTGFAAARRSMLHSSDWDLFLEPTFLHLDKRRNLQLS
jgi:hypothetical protein